MAKTYYACMYDWEGDGSSWFLKGSKKACEAAVNKMAELLGVEPTSEAEIKEDPGEANNRPLVLSKDPGRSCITKVEKARGDGAYGAGAIMVGYPDMDPDENCYFQPYETSGFEVGDKAILACFHASAPGGWTLVDLEMSRTEYWQEGYISDTSGDGEDDVVDEEE